MPSSYANCYLPRLVGVDSLKLQLLARIREKLQRESHDLERLDDLARTGPTRASNHAPRQWQRQPSQYITDGLHHHYRRLDSSLTLGRDN